MSSSYVHDPDSVLDYEWDWAAWLAEGETIATAQVIVPAGLVLDSESNTGTTVTAWISGGTAGETHMVTARITTTQGRTDDRSIWLITRER